MEILGIILFVPLAGITIVALFAALILLIPTPIEKTRTHLENTPARSLLLGIVNFIFFAILATILVWLAEQSGGLLGGIFVFFAGIIMLGFAIYALLGLAAFVNLLGEHIGGEKTPFVSNLRGGTLLLLAALAPYIGWLVFTPLVIWTGFGAAISALIRRKKVSPPEEK